MKRCCKKVLLPHISNVFSLYEVKFISLLSMWVRRRYELEICENEHTSGFIYCSFIYSSITTPNQWFVGLFEEENHWNQKLSDGSWKTMWRHGASRWIWWRQLKTTTSEFFHYLEIVLSISMGDIEWRRNSQFSWYWDQTN